LLEGRIRVARFATQGTRQHIVKRNVKLLSLGFGFTAKPETSTIGNSRKALYVNIATADENVAKNEG